LVKEAESIDVVLTRHLQAAGGDAALQRITTRVTEAVIDSSSSGLQTRVTVQHKLPNLIVVEREAAGLGKTVAGFDGREGWETSEVRGFRPLRDREINDLLAFCLLGGDPYLKNHYPLKKWASELTIDGRPAVGVRLSSFDAHVGTFFFDRETGRLMRGEFPGQGGAPPLRIDYLDFSVVGDVVLPFRTEYRVGAETTSIVCSSVQHNVELHDAIFRPRRDD
jgi:hypothetical protein